MNLIGYKWRLPGFLLIIAALVMALLYFAFSFRFEIPVLALISSYKETNFFTLFRTNFADESIMLALTAGLALVVFSKEREELEIYKELRMSAFATTAIVNTLILFFSVLFIYGSGFMVIVILNLFLPSVIYLIVFNIKKSMALNPHRQNSNQGTPGKYHP